MHIFYKYGNVTGGTQRFPAWFTYRVDKQVYKLLNIYGIPPCNKFLLLVDWLQIFNLIKIRSVLRPFSSLPHIDLEAVEQWDLGNSAVEASVLSKHHFGH